MRTCVACGVKAPKSDLLRVVGTAEGQPSVDIKGRSDGRGAYVCKGGVTAGTNGLAVRIKRALHMESEVTDEFLEELADALAGGNEVTSRPQRKIEDQ